MAAGVAEAAILARGLATVTAGTERLPTVRVPEPLCVAAVRDDVIDGVGRAHAPLALAFSAERMLRQEMSPGALPPGRGVKRSNGWITLAGVVPVSLTFVASPHGAMDGRANSHGASQGRKGWKTTGGVLDALLPIISCL